MGSGKVSPRMNRRRYPPLAVAVPCLLLATLPGGPWARAADGGGPPVPELSIEAPPEYAHHLERLEGLDRRRLEGAMQLAGLDRPGPPIRVVLAREGSPEAAAVPSWAAGYALGGGGPVVLFPGRAGSYPYDSLEELLQHEVAHVLVDRAARGRPVPRWLHEGIAMTAGGAWGLEDRTRFGLAVARQGEVPLASLDQRFAGGSSAAAGAYALAGGFVSHLLRRHGPGVTGAILAGLADGLPPAEAFHRATGETLAAAEASFWRRQTLWHRWVPFLTSSTALWIGVTLLALWAIRRRRERDALLAARWEAEEAARAEASPGGAQGGGPWVH